MLHYILFAMIQLACVHGKPILWMTTKDVENIPEHMYESWHENTQGFELRIYDDMQAQRKLQDVAPREVNNLFHNLRPPWKYDMWRTFMLYKYGGVYLDIKTILKSPLTSFFAPERVMMTRGHRGDQGVHIGVMGGPAKHAVFGEWLIRALDRGFPHGEQYHFYCALMEGVIQSHENIDYLQETNTTYPNCQKDRYGLCGRIFDQDKRLVALSRDSSYPWRQKANTLHRLKLVNGEFYTLRPPNQRIPKKMHFIWMQKNLMEHEPTSNDERAIVKNIERVQSMNPEYTVHFMDDQICQEQIQETGLNGVLQIYNTVRTSPRYASHSWAYMADICRLAALYNEGGIYMDSNMMMRLPFREWLDYNADFVAPLSACKHKRDFFNSLLGSTKKHPATLLSLQYIVQDWDGTSWKDYYTHYSPDEKKIPFCLNQMGTIYTYKGWKQTDGRHTQLLDERVHFRETFKNVPARALKDNKWYTMCNAIVVDPKTNLVPFYSHMLDHPKAECSMEGSTPLAQKEDRETFDIVITWVDWSNKHFIQKLQDAGGRSEGCESGEFIEMKYMLRSLKAHNIPYGHIYIVYSDNHPPPKYLRETESLTFIPHSALVKDPSYLPLIHRESINAHLHRIPNLSRYFVHWEDDLILMNPKKVNNLFRDYKNRKISSGDQLTLWKYTRSSFTAWKPMGLAYIAFHNSANLFGVHERKEPTMAFGHDICFYDRQVMEELESTYPEYFEATMSYKDQLKERHKEPYIICAHCLFKHYLVSKMGFQAVPHIGNKIWRERDKNRHDVDVMEVHVNEKHCKSRTAAELKERLQFAHRATILNGQGSGISDEYPKCEWIHNVFYGFLEKTFPQKSEFERE